MATVIDALVVTLGLDPRQWHKGGQNARDELKKTREEATKDSKEIEIQGKKAAEFFTGLRREVTALFAAFAGGVGLTKFITGTAAANTNIGYMADNLNMSRQSLFAWQEMVKQVGGTAEDATSTLQNLANMASLQHLQPAAFAAQYGGWFNAAGLSLNDIQGDKTTFILKAVQNLRKRFAGDQQTQQNFASMLGINANMFNAAIQPNARGRLGQLEGMAPTDDQIKRAQEFTRAISNLKSRLTEIRNEVVSYLFPDLDQLANKFADFAGKHIPLFAGALASLVAAVAVVTASLWLPLLPIMAVGLAISTLIDDFISFKTSGKSAFDWGAIVKTLNGFIRDTIKVINNVIAAIWPAVQAFMGFAKAAGHVALDAAPNFIKALSNLGGAIGRLIGDLVKIAGWLVKAFGPAAIELLKGALKGLTEGINFVADVIRTIIDLLTGKWSDAWKDAKKAGIDALKGIGDAMEGLFRAGEKIGAWNKMKPGGDGGPAPQIDGMSIPVPERGKGGSARYNNPSVIREAGATVEAFLKSNGFNPEVARGIAAGIFAESRFNPNAFNGQGGGNGAFGLGQWRGERQAELFRRFGKNPTMEQQLQYMLWELKNGNLDKRTRNAYNDLLHARTANEALNIWIREVERPGFLGSYSDLKNGSQYLSAVNSNVPSGAKTKHAQSTAANSNAKAGNQVHHETHIGQINVQTQAKDADGIAKSIGASVQKHPFVQPANTGLQ